MDENSWSSWFDRAADVGVAYINRNKPAAAKPAAVATAPAQPPWLKPVLIGGGVLALVAILFAAFRK